MGIFCEHESTRLFTRLHVPSTIWIRSNGWFTWRTQIHDGRHAFGLAEDLAFLHMRHSVYSCLRILFLITIAKILYQLWFANTIFNSTTATRQSFVASRKTRIMVKLFSTTALLTGRGNNSVLVIEPSSRWCCSPVSCSVRDFGCGWWCEFLDEQAWGEHGHGGSYKSRWFCQNSFSDHTLITNFIDRRQDNG